ncbi:MAG: DNA internalization-related competence protein ComEC/Rec2 [Betaproteobacteria bacterium HGW-Betaproteobacteria-22]|nr:MAG: DNA internalization-related competence protein ComEC/Rec2 [Betaproteobacteria bacterium HGW-Betaproteobacteria-22]
MILFALAFVLGALGLQQMPVLPDWPWVLCLAPILLLYLLLQRNSQPVFGHFKGLVIVVLGFGFGFFWAAGYAAYRLSDALPHAWESKPILLVGVVASVPELTERGQRFRFDVEQVLTYEAKVPQHISLNHYSAEYVNRVVAQPVVTQPVVQPVSFWAGERWQLTVRLKRPHGVQNPHGYDFESWALAERIRAAGNVLNKPDNQKIEDFVWHPRYVVERIRQHVKDRIARVLIGRPYAGVIQALVMGDDSQISVQDWQLFLRTGITHLMSISGLHITMLSGLMFALVNALWRRIPSFATKVPARKAATLAGMLTALSYALVAGFSVPTQRTLYMLMVFGLALWSGRQFVISQVLALALLVVVVIDPWAVLAAGFWLSFGAVAILSYALGARVGQTHWLKASIQVQWAVTLGMLPLLLILFHQASIISPVANAFAIPLISFFVTPLALLGSFLHLDWPLHLAYLILNFCVQLLQWLDGASVAVWQQHAPPTWTLLPALLGMMWLLLPSGVPLRWLGLFGVLPMVVLIPDKPELGEMKVTVLDVGQGLSVVVQTKRHVLVYDAGARFNQQSDAGGRIVVPYLQGEGVRKLDGVVISHDDNDHSGGASSLMTLMSVDWLASSMPDATRLPKANEKMKCYKGQHWQWDGVDFEILHPHLDDYAQSAISDNNRSCVLKVSSTSGSVLLTGDIEKQIEFALISEYADSGAKLKSDVLIAPHHGSKTSSSSEFLQEVQPSLAIFTAGYLNRFKHPRPEVVARYQEAGSLTFRSDYHGALILNFSAQENKIHVSSWRQQNKRYWHNQYD